MSDPPEQPRAAADVPATYWLRPRTNRVLLAAVGLIALGCLAWLIFGPKPWDESLDFSEEAKEHIRTHAWAVKGLWYAALINFFLSAAALTAWHFRPGEMCMLRQKATSQPGIPTSTGENAVLISLVVAAMVLAGAMMLPRLSLSFWGDEEATARRHVIGNVRRIEDGSFVLIPAPWKRALWNWDNGPNNHMLFNVLARLSHGPGDISKEHPGRFYFDESRIRLPSFIATLVMIAGAAWLTALLGAPRGSPLVALFLALHPWIIRYGSEARGYALMMAFAVLTACFLLRAFRSERALTWWIVFGLSEALLLGSHLSAVYFLVPLNLAAFWMAWSPRIPGHRNLFRVADVWRLAGANLLGAALVIQMMLPNALQVPGWAEKTTHSLSGKSVEISWIENWLSFWSSGMPWHTWDRKNPLALTLGDAFSSRPVAAGTAVGLLGLLLLAGVLSLLARRGCRVWVFPLLLPVPLMLLVTWKTGTILFPWYSVGFLPLAAIVCGIGFAFLAGPLRRLPKTAAISGTLALAAAVLISFGLLSHPQRQLYRTHSVEPLAESVRKTREVVNPFHPAIDETLTLGFVHATQLYDPAMIYARSDEQFVAAVQRAEDNDLTLWVNAANLNLGRPVFPKAYALLDDRETFEEPEILHGLQVPCTRYLFRYKPGALPKSDR